MLQFGEPKALLYVLLPLLLGVGFLLKRREARKIRQLPLGSLGGVVKRETRRTRLAFRAIFALSILAMAFLALAAARPQRVTSWAKRFSEGIDIVIVLDVSESMEATDLAPTRILAAKRVVRDFITRRADDRIGIVIFGGEAVTKAPLTRDYEFLRFQIEDIRLRELKQGTAIGNGLANGIGRLRHSESKTKVIVLLTDGDNNVGAINPITAANLARQENIKIYSIGMGSEDRVVVPIYAYDIYGRKTQLVAQVPSYINPELLRQIARITGGKSWMARDTGALQQVLAEVDRLEKTRVRLLPMQRTDELFLYPAMLSTILLGLVYLLLETRFRRVRRVETTLVADESIPTGVKRASFA